MPHLPRATCLHLPSTEQRMRQLETMRRLYDCATCHVPVCASATCFSNLEYNTPFFERFQCPHESNQKSIGHHPGIKNRHRDRDRDTDRDRDRECIASCYVAKPFLICTQVVTHLAQNQRSSLFGAMVFCWLQPPVRQVTSCCPFFASRLQTECA